MSLPVEIEFLRIILILTLLMSFSRPSVEFDVTFGIKSSGREKHVNRLVQSMHKFAPEIPIVIADDGRNPLVIGLQLGVTIIQLSYDAGLSAGRNALIDNITTEYMIYFDDDFVMTPLTDYKAMVQILNKFHDVDVVGASVADRVDWGFTFRREGKNLYQELPQQFMGHRDCKKVDIVPNFFAARVNSLRQVRWDEHFKLGEHEDFFLRVKEKKLGVITCRCATVDHKPETKWYTGNSNELTTYERRRFRAFGYMQDFLQKNGIERYYSVSNVLLASNEKILREQSNQAALTDALKLKEWHINNRVTVVLMSWKRPENIIKLLSYFADIEHVSEVVVWNNNVDKPLRNLRFDKARYSLIVHNSPLNLNTLGRWTACAELATNPLCFFIDDDFLPTMFKHLLMSYNRAPNTLHAATNPITFFNNLRWGIEDSERGIHTSFSWVGSGSIVSRKMASEFVKKTVVLSEKDRNVCDNAFSYFTNQYPSQMMAQLDIGDLGQDNAFSVGKVLDELQEARIRAIEALVRNRQKWYPDIPNTLPKAPVMAAHSTQPIVLITNKRQLNTSPSPLQAIHQSSFWQFIYKTGEIEIFKRKLCMDSNCVWRNDYCMNNDRTKCTDFQISRIPTRKELNSVWDHSALAAVDSNFNTFWEIPSVSSGDYFTLDLLDIVDIGTINLIASHEVKELLVHLSGDGINWHPYNFIGRIKMTACNHTSEPPCANIILPLDGFLARYVKFVAEWQFDQPLRIWEVSRSVALPVEQARLGNSPTLVLIELGIIVYIVLFLCRNKLK